MVPRVGPVAALGLVPDVSQDVAEVVTMDLALVMTPVIEMLLPPIVAVVLERNVAPVVEAVVIADGNVVLVFLCVSKRENTFHL